MSIWQFSSRRMVEDYSAKFYRPLLESYDVLAADGAARTRALVREKLRLQDTYGGVAINYPQIEGRTAHFHSGDTMRVTTEVFLGDLQPEEVRVEVYYGPVNSQNEILRSHKLEMEKVEGLGGGRYLYAKQLVCSENGRFGMTARVMPSGAEWQHVIPGFLRWAGS